MYGEVKITHGDYLVILDVRFGRFVHYFLLCKNGLDHAIGVLNPHVGRFFTTDKQKHRGQRYNKLEYLKTVLCTDLAGLRRVRLPLGDLLLGGLVDESRDESASWVPVFRLPATPVSREVAEETCKAVFEVMGIPWPV